VQFPIGRTGQHPVPPTPLPPSVRSLVHMHWQTPSVLSLGAFFVAGKSISDFVLNSQTYRFGRTSPGSLPAAHRLSASRSSDLSERSSTLPISPKVLAVWRTPRQCAAPRRALAARAETGDEDPFRNTCKQGSAYWRLLRRNSYPVPRQTRGVGSGAQTCADNSRAASVVHPKGMGLRGSVGPSTG